MGGIKFRNHCKYESSEHFVLFFTAQCILIHTCMHSAFLYIHVRTNLSMHDMGKNCSYKKNCSNFSENLLLVKNTWFGALHDLVINEILTTLNILNYFWNGPLILTSSLHNCHNDCTRLIAVGEFFYQYMVVHWWQ